MSPRDWVCLMYHDVSREATRPGGGREFFSVTRETFGRQLEAIRAMGATGCSIADAMTATRQKVVAISFDDGDLGQATNGFPTLVEHGMTATFFVTTGWIGTRGYASWDQLREMKAAGMSVQSHTHTHPFLSEMSRAQLSDELRRSRDVLDEQLAQTTTMLALPGGDAPRPEFRGLLAELGYEVVATSRWGVNGRVGSRRPLYVKRCTVRGEPSDNLFRAIASGDRLLAAKKQSREAILAFIRRSLGPTRYARWRTRFLDAAAGPGTPD